MPAKKKTTKTAAAKKAPAKKAAATNPETQSAEVPVVETEQDQVVAVEEKAPEPVRKIEPVKMTAFIKKQQQKLLDLRDDLMEALYGVQNETIKAASTGSDNGSGQHQGDAGSDSYDRDLALSMLEKEKDALMEVEKALERIDAGVYGICEASGEKIPQERLEVLPFARLTMVERQKWEEERRTRGVHPGDYGFGAFSESSRSVSLDASDD